MGILKRIVQPFQLFKPETKAKRKIESAENKTGLRFLQF